MSSIDNAIQTAATAAPVELMAQGLTKRFKVAGFGDNARFLHAVESVDVELQAGRTLGVVGESGCGKSTLGRLLAGLIRPTAGTVSIHGRRLIDANSANRLRGRVQYVFQDPAGGLDPRMAIGDSVAEPLVGVARDERRIRSAKMLERVGIPAAFGQKRPHELSGGQQQRVCIARALNGGQRVVVLDEVVSALDAIVRTQVLHLLRLLQADLGLAYMFISHDLAATAAISDDVAVMYLGEVDELAPVSSFTDAGALHPYSVALLAARLRVGPDRSEAKRIVLHGDVPSPVNRPTGCPFHTRCPIARPQCATDKPRLTQAQAGHQVACHFPGELKATA